MPWWKRGNTAERDPKASEARRQAERQLEQRREETTRIDTMTAGWRRIREENHFAAAINATFRGSN